MGTTTLTCSATDKAGNTGTSDPFNVVVTDTTAPVVTTPANIVVGNDAATVTYANATATDLVDGTVAASCTPASGTKFALGTTTVTCSATDKAGNKGTNTFTVEVQDVDQADRHRPGRQDRRGDRRRTAPPSPTTRATAEDDVDGSPDAVTCSKASGTVFPLGTTKVTCSATDKAGNIGDSFFTVTVAGHHRSGSERARQHHQGGHLGRRRHRHLQRLRQRHRRRLGRPRPASRPPAPRSPSARPTVICSATDEAGNTGTDSFTVTVRDTTAPAVKVPANEVAEATGPNGAKVAYGDVSATDIVDGPMNPSCSQASDTVFPLGTTTVTCTATDAAGNKGTNSFTVKVVDTTAPDVQAPANLVVGNTSATGADNVVYTGATADDLVSGNLPVTCTPASGSTFALGINTVTCKATDAAGNTGTATFTIEVQDQTKPTVTVPADITAEATGPNGATVSYIGVTASDDVDGPLTATCSKASGTVFPIGTTTVTCSATDKAGNKGDNTFTVTVEDTTAPNLTVSAAKTATATSAARGTGHLHRPDGHRHRRRQRRR